MCKRRSPEHKNIGSRQPALEVLAMRTAVFGGYKEVTPVLDMRNTLCPNAYSTSHGGALNTQHKLICWFPSAT